MSADHGPATPATVGCRAGSGVLGMRWFAVPVVFHVGIALLCATDSRNDAITERFRGGADWPAATTSGLFGPAESVLRRAVVDLALPTAVILALNIVLLMAIAALLTAITTEFVRSRRLRVALCILLPLSPAAVSAARSIESLPVLLSMTLVLGGTVLGLRPAVAQRRWVRDACAAAAVIAGGACSIVLALFPLVWLAARARGREHPGPGPLLVSTCVLASVVVFHAGASALAHDPAIPSRLAVAAVEAPWLAIAPASRAPVYYVDALATPIHAVPIIGFVLAGALLAPTIRRPSGMVSLTLFAAAALGLCAESLLAGRWGEAHLVVLSGLLFGVIALRAARWCRALRLAKLGQSSVRLAGIAAVYLGVAGAVLWRSEFSPWDSVPPRWRGPVVRLQLARSSLERGDGASALVELAGLERYATLNGIRTLRSAATYAQTHDSAEGARLAELEIRSVWGVDAHVAAARVARSLGQHDLGASLLESAYRHPLAGEAVLAQYVSALFSAGRPDVVVEMLDAGALDELDAKERHAARALFLARRFERAKPALEAALRKSPEDADVLRMLGKLNFESGRPDDAEHLYIRSLAAAPNQPELHADLALLYESTKRTPLAIHHLRTALRQGGSEWQLRRTLELRLTALTRQAPSGR